MKNLETEGTQVNNIKDWEDAAETKNFSGQDEDLKKIPKDGSWATAVISNGPEFLQRLESNLAFTVMFLSIVGYVIIAAFGQMDSFKKYIQYLFFLILVFCVYKILKLDSFWKLLFKKINSVIFTLLIILLLIVVIQNISFITAHLPKFR